MVSRAVRFGDEPTQVRALDAAWVHIGSRTHQPNAKRGIFWCAVCGAYGGARLQHLARPCRKVPTPRGRDVLSRLQRGLTLQSNVPWFHAPGQCDDSIDLTRQNQENGSRGRADEVGAAQNPPCGKRRRLCKSKNDAEPGQPISVNDSPEPLDNFENIDEMEYDDPLGWGGALHMAEDG